MIAEYEDSSRKLLIDPAPTAMHCVQLANLAALLAQHGGVIFRPGFPLPSQAIVDYWSASQSRQQLWHRTMARYRDAKASGDAIAMRSWWRRHIGVLEEILVSELLTRVVAMLALTWDLGADDDEVSPITDSVYRAHVETSGRVHQLLLFGRGHGVSDAVRLNRLRRGVERWTDTLLGLIAADARQDPATYAIDAVRAIRFAEDFRGDGVGSLRNIKAMLIASSMNENLRRRTDHRVSLPQANHAVAKAVLLMLRPDLFDSVGTLKSLWLHRLQHGADRAENVVRELAQNDLNEACYSDSIEAIHSPVLQRWYLSE